MTRRNLALTIAAVSSVSGIICICCMNDFLQLPDILELASLIIALGGALASYVIGGGLLAAVSFSWSIAKFGWFIIPVFPVDIITGLCGFFLGVYVFLFVPIIPVFFGGREAAA